MLNMNRLAGGKAGGEGGRDRLPGLLLDIQELSRRVDFEEDVTPVLGQPQIDRAIDQTEPPHQSTQFLRDIIRQVVCNVFGVEIHSHIGIIGQVPARPLRRRIPPRR
jgi:hypothetical protein